MRSRLIVVPAAVIVTAAYLKGRRDGRLEYRPAPAEPVIPTSPLMDQERIARALAADAVELAEAQAAAAGTVLAPVGPPSAADPDGEWEDPFATPDAVFASEWVAAPAPVGAAAPTRSESGHQAVLVAEPEPVVAVEPELSVEVRVDETGRFSLGGYATQAGHIALAGITFRERRSGIVAPDSVALVAEAANNVAPGGLVVLGDAGFAPDAEGFTILLAAEGPGTFAAAGYYELAAR